MHSSVFFWISLELIDRSDFRLHIRRGTLHLNGNRVHQSFESTGIVCKPGDEFVGLHRLWHQNSSCEAFDRQIGGIENVAVHIDDVIDPRRGRLRPGQWRQRCFAGR